MKSYTVAFDDKCFEKIDVTLHWDTRDYTYEAFYLLKMSETKTSVRFLVLVKVDEVPTVRLWRTGMRIWQHSLYKSGLRPFAESGPQMITLV